MHPITEFQFPACARTSTEHSPAVCRETGPQAVPSQEMSCRRPLQSRAWYKFPDDSAMKPNAPPAKNVPAFADRGACPVAGTLAQLGARALCPRLHTQRPCLRAPACGESGNVQSVRRPSWKWNVNGWTQAGQLRCTETEIARREQQKNLPRC